MGGHPAERAGDLTALGDPTVREGEGAPPSSEHDGPRRILGLIRTGTHLAWVSAARELSLCVALQVTAGVGIAFQLLLGRSVIAAVVQDRGPDAGLSDVLPTLIALAVVTAIVAGCTVLLLERQRVLAALVERHVQDRILDVVAEVPLTTFEDARFHDRLRRATVNASERSWQVAIAIVSLFSAAATLVPLAIVLGRIEPLVLPAVLIAYVPLHFATTRNGRASYDFSYWQTTADRERAYLGGVLLGPGAAKEVRLFASGGWIRERYDGLYDRRIAELRRLAVRRSRRSLLATAWTTTVTVLGVAALVHWALTGRLTPADAAIAAIAVQQLGTRVRMLGSTAGSLHECSLFLDDIVTFLELPTESAQPERARPPERFSTLTVDDLRFTYPGTDVEVLKGLSLEIGRGEVVAIVGANGSGKTTLAKLLCGLYVPTSGRVLWDDVDLADCDPVLVRRRVAAAFQDFARYELSGRQNIGLGDTARMDDAAAVRAAAIEAGADDALVRLPAGYDTRLSRAFEDGADLSGGEWQRVALARAFLRDAPFLVLDEPTASLDPRAERALFDTVRRLQQGRAVLLISHRLASVRSADRIYVLDAGEIIESGTHADLMQRHGRYAELFTLQAQAYAAGAEPLVPESAT